MAYNFNITNAYKRTCNRQSYGTVCFAYSFDPL